MTQVLTADGLKKSFDDLVAVDGVSFSIEEGETFGLLGQMEPARQLRFR